MHTREYVHMFHKRLIWACDLIILNACCLAVMQVWLVGINWLLGLSLLNCIAIVALRQFLMSVLEIPGLVSLLNRVLKRTADILTSLIFLLTVFPVIIVIQAIIIKSNKQYGGPLFTAKDVWIGDTGSFTAIVFSNCPCNNGPCLGMTPLALRLLTGKISLTDISSLSIKPTVAEGIHGDNQEELPNVITNNDIIYPVLQDGNESDSSI